MNRFWKWTLGILGILILLTVIAIPFALHHRFGFNMARGFEGGHGPMLQNHHGFGFDRFHGPMMVGRGFGHGHGIFFLFGGLLKLAFLAALLYGAYWLGKRNARVVLDPAASTPAPTVEPGEPSEPGRKVV
jgi:hypothetical protein